MNKVITFSLFFFLLSSLSFSSELQKFKVKSLNQPVSTGSDRWNTDYLISSSEPLGKHSGVYRISDSTIYVSVPDTNIVTGAAIVIFTSTDNGENWNILSTLTPASVIPKTKMIRSSLDSVYCFFLSGVTIYCWNVINNRVTQVRGVGFRDFDVGASSTGSMYIFMDSLGTNNLVRYGSSDGGVIWGQRGLITTAGAHPRIYFSGSGDTLVLNYYGPVLADTMTSVIRNARYRETAPGTLATAGSFTNIVASNEKKEQFSSVAYGRFVYFFYTSESAGNTDIKCKVSTNYTVSFFDSLSIAPVSGRNEFWFDAKHHANGIGGVDMLFISYIPPESSGDGLKRIWYISGNNVAPNSYSFLNPVMISSSEALTSSNGYIPALIPYYNGSGDLGAAWVANIAKSIGLYFDRLKNYSVLNLTVSFEACVPPADSITVLLRSISSPYGIVDSSRAVTNSSGNASVNFTNPLDGINYYLVVKHRNSIETWSKDGGEAFSSGSLTYDFTTAASQAYGDNMILANGEYSFFTGDPTQDGIVDGNDGAMIDNDASNFNTGYLVTDLNCDSIVDGTDAAYADNNAANFVSKISP